ncbi:YycH family regulatory protein [Chengkuizengella axinellae]|uniref:Two-component system activity regulator YycH n=1 Tax=Chengkuizengella axinellae TaxID=3064388 RepID=A0ABT9J363_9BACL|nr:two-component system activity regulator YycH [Chengkuizengella sp. 2205SS18-9]MDP5276051.1 two-component system activity regulator YycH [Chengkuizengella sp. 2205SS18-9]
MEKIKSVILTLLVFGSLFQSYLLVYSKPDFNPAVQDEYIDTRLNGNHENVENMIFPKHIVLHFGEDKHTMLYPNFKFYNDIYEKITQRTFENFRPVTIPSLERIKLKEYQGIELEFMDGIPIQWLQNTMQVKPENINLDVSVDKIWIYVTETQEIRALFFVDSGLQVFEATKVDLKVEDLYEFVGYGEFLSTYHTTNNGKYYLPDEPIEVVRLTVNYNDFERDQLVASLFVDPSITSTAVDNDGKEIILDGASVLEMNHKQFWMSYNDYETPVESSSELLDDLLTSIQFANQHGGWSRTNLISKIPEQTEQQIFRFQQYVKPAPNVVALPILPTDSFKLGYTEITMKEGVVTNYDRSLINLSSVTVNREPYTLQGGEALEQLVLEKEKNLNIINIFPAYYPIIDEYILLIPSWAYELSDGTLGFLK